MASDKEIKVLRALRKESNKARKQMAQDLKLSESELSRTITELTRRGIIKRFTVELDYSKLGFQVMGMIAVSLADKRQVSEIARKLVEVKEIIELNEVFGERHDMIIIIMCESNEKFREIHEDVLNLEGVKSDANTFALIFPRTYKRLMGVDV